MYSAVFSERLRRKNGAMLQLLINVLTLRILGWTRAANINVPCNLAWVNRDIGACCCYQLFRVRYIGMIAVHAQCTRSMCSQVGHLAASAICLLPIEHLWDPGNHTWRAAITASLYFYIGHDQPWSPCHRLVKFFRTLTRGYPSSCRTLPGSGPTCTLSFQVF